MFRKQTTLPQFSKFTTFAFGRGLRLAVLVMVLGVNGRMVGAADLYVTNFDSLSQGRTQPDPGTSTQDGWFRQLALGDAFGEIQSTIAYSGQALHQHTATTNPAGQQTIDSRKLGVFSLTGISTVTLSAQFYASSSNYGTVNTYDASLAAYGGPHPGFQIIGFSLYGGNGQTKSQTGLQVHLTGFNGSTNNEQINLSVGQNLSWDAWHSVSVSLDQQADTWLSITIDGQTQNLQGFKPGRSFDGSQWIRGQRIETLAATINPSDVGNVRTNDEVYWDNIALSYQSVPEPSTYAFGLIAAGVIGFVTRRRRGDQNHA